MAYSLAVRPSSGSRTWTVIDDGYRTVAPVEEWLEAHRHLWSPNTVRGYATALAQWWTFLEQRGETERWREVGVPAVTGFLSWLRNGRTVEHALVAPPGAPSAETLEARLAALISFYRWQEAVFGVPVAATADAWGTAARTRPGGCWLTWTPARRRARRRWCGCVVTAIRAAAAVAAAGEIQAILDGCAVHDAGRAASGWATCVTGCCSPCWRRQAAGWARCWACGSATS